MEKTCVLCGECLDKYPVNREHFIPQVLIREFNKLCIPNDFTWVERALHYGVSRESDRTIVRRSDHKTWAVVQVHERCNLDASPMCQDLRYIIDHLDEKIDGRYFYRPISYYASLWRVPVEQVSFSILTKEEANARRGEDDFMLLYYPGLLNCGRILIYAEDSFVDKRVASNNDYEWHTIVMGTPEAIK